MTESDEHHLRSAEGWLDLDHAVEAAEELDLISPEGKAHPAVLLVRCRLYLDVHKPDITHVIATALTEKLPELPDCWFYLACAGARLNKNDDAESALKRCFLAAAYKDEEQKWQDRALATRDLDGFWDQKQQKF
nr:tetratricopeptide repeat protein [uncultured bacterium]